jgi:hypothetical protein
VNNVYCGVYSDDDGKSISGYTYGLDKFGKKDIEILNTTNNAGDVRKLLIEVCSYVVENDVNLRHGETIGFTEEQKLQITESAGVAIDEITLKIQF